MINSAQIPQAPGSIPFIPRNHLDGGKEPVADTPTETIPARYRNGAGGIDLEQVRRDQRQARRAFMQSIGRRLGARLRKH